MESYRRNNSVRGLSPLIFDELLQMENDLQRVAISNSITKMQFRDALDYFDIVKKFDDELNRSDSEIKAYFQLTFSYYQEDVFIKLIAKRIYVSQLQLKLLFEVARTL
jgi:hypothetical protein